MSLAMSRNSARVLCFSSWCVYAIVSPLLSSKSNTLCDIRALLKYHVEGRHVESKPNPKNSRPRDCAGAGATHLRRALRSVFSAHDAHARVRSGPGSTPGNGDVAVILRKATPASVQS